MTGQIEPGSIVVGVDGSADAERAVRWAAEQAGLENRALVVVVATDVGNIRAGDAERPREGTGPSGRGTVPAEAREIAEQAAERARRLVPSLQARILPTLGDPRRVLLELSADAQLIVVGSRGRGTLRSMLLGSVSATVSKHAECPVVVCRPSTPHRTARGVVVGADGTPESLPVIEFAFAQASFRELPLTVLHCYWDALAAAARLRDSTVPVPEPDDLEEMRVMLSESVAGLSEKYPDVKVDLEVEHGLVDQTISGSDTDWDLVVVGRHARHSLRSWVVGSISTSVVERARTTVAVVPEAAS